MPKRGPSRKPGGEVLVRTRRQYEFGSATVVLTMLTFSTARPIPFGAIPSVRRAAIVWGSALALFIGSACAATGPAADTGSSSGVGGFTGSSGSGDGGFDTCASASDEAKLVPVNMYILFDKSGSMAGVKWSQTTAAVQSFFEDPGSAGLRVALRFFPDGACDSSCKISACATPKVALGELTELSAPTDTHEQALFDAFVGVLPSGGTPLSAALSGGYLWAEGVLQQHPSEKAVVVLVTDGKPEDCDTSESNIAASAAAAYTDRGIITFAIGLEGSSTSLMTALAMKGGSGEAVFVDTDGAKEQLSKALSEIRESTVACEYNLPTEAGGEDVDPALVNMLYTPGGETESITIGQVADASACNPQVGGWYYDDPVNPKRLILCASSCGAIRSDTGGKIDILFGCSTVPA